MGDPSGIGPEVVAKLLSDTAGLPRAVVIGDAGVLMRTKRGLGLPLSVRTIASPEEATFEPGAANVIQACDQLPEDLPLGKVDRRSGRAAFESVKLAIKLALAGEVSAITTAPLNKEALHAAGVSYPGHTEILADLGRASGGVAMMLMNDDLRVVLVTIHASMRTALELITVDREIDTIALADGAVRRFGIANPRVAVAGLNPHAGENGLFGREDLDVIRPAIDIARSRGINASGPWPGDTVFMRARKGEFDIVVAQYHDQGLIPIKYMGIERGVNVTLGLPFVRTSVDHGTAFDIAGRGIADPTSLRQALIAAETLASHSK